MATLIADQFNIVSCFLTSRKRKSDGTLYSESTIGMARSALVYLFGLSGHKLSDWTENTIKELTKGHRNQITVARENGVYKVFLKYDCLDCEWIWHRFKYVHVGSRWEGVFNPRRLFGFMWCLLAFDITAMDSYFSDSARQFNYMKLKYIMWCLAVRLFFYGSLFVAKFKSIFAGQRK